MASFFASVVACLVAFGVGVAFSDKVKALFKAKVSEAETAVKDEIKAKL